VLAEWVEQCHLLILTPYDVRLRRQVAPTACYAASRVGAGKQSVFRKECIFSNTAFRGVLTDGILF